MSIIVRRSHSSFSAAFYSCLTFPLHFGESWASNKQICRHKITNKAVVKQSLWHEDMCFYLKRTVANDIQGIMTLNNWCLRMIYAQCRVPLTLQCPGMRCRCLESSGSPHHSFYQSMSEGSWVAALLCLGALFGSVPAGLISEHFGRKKTLLYLALPLLVSWILVASR